MKIRFIFFFIYSPLFQIFLNPKLINSVTKKWHFLFFYTFSSHSFPTLQNKLSEVSSGFNISGDLFNQEQNILAFLFFFKIHKDTLKVTFNVKYQEKEMIFVFLAWKSSRSCFFKAISQ